MNYAEDPSVLRLKKQCPGVYRAPKVLYKCKLCGRVKTTNLVVAWLHSMQHGPWPIEGSLGESAVHTLTRKAWTNGLAHPRVNMN